MKKKTKVFLDFKLKNEKKLKSIRCLEIVSKYCSADVKKE
jgi:hypothetical protein